MPTLEEMQELVQAHAGLEDRMEEAIWIRQQDDDAWLVELLPDLPPDGHPERPVQFNAGRSFRYALHLIAANADDLGKAIRMHADLASWVAEGQPLHGGEAALAIIELARTHGGHAKTG